MAKVKIIGSDMGPMTERPKLGQAVMKMARDHRMDDEQLAVLFELQPGDRRMTTAEQYGLAMLWSLTSEDDQFRENLEAAARDMFRQKPYFLSGSLKNMASYFPSKMGSQLELDAPNHKLPSLIDANGNFRFDVKAYMAFHGGTLEREMKSALLNDPARLETIVKALRAHPDNTQFSDQLERLQFSSEMKDLPIEHPGRRVFFGSEVKIKEVVDYINNLVSFTVFGSDTLEEKADLVEKAESGIQKYNALSEELRLGHIQDKVRLEDNSDLSFDLPDGCKCAALMLSKIDSDGSIMSRVYATHKAQEFEVLEDLLVSVINELPDQPARLYLGQRDVWLGGFVMNQPIERLAALNLRNDGWYKLYQLTDNPVFKGKVRGAHLDRVMSQDLGL